MHATHWLSQSFTSSAIPIQQKRSATAPASASVPNDLRIMMHDKTEKVVLCQPSEPTTATGRSENFSSATTCHCRRRTNYSGNAKMTVVPAAYSSPQPKPEIHLPPPNHATPRTLDPPSVEPRYETESPEVSTGRERSSSNLAIQSSPDCTGTKSASSELPVDTESNGWSES